LPIFIIRLIFFKNNKNAKNAYSYSTLFKFLILCEVLLDRVGYSLGLGGARGERLEESINTIEIGFIEGERGIKIDFWLMCRFTNS